MSTNTALPACSQQLRPSLMMYHPVNHRNSVFKSKITMGRNDFVDEMVFGRLDCFKAAKTYECCQSDGIVLTQGQIVKSK